jgi:hypothetical protein
MALLAPKVILGMIVAMQRTGERKVHPINYLRPEWLAEQSTLGGYDIGDMRLQAAEIAEIIHPISRLLQCDEVAVFRGIAVVAINILKIGGQYDLGRYWAYDISGVGLYGTSGGRPSLDGRRFIVVDAVVSPQQIDWEETVAANLWNPEEKEITLRPGTLAAVRGIDAPHNPNFVDFGRLRERR